MAKKQYPPTGGLGRLDPQPRGQEQPTPCTLPAAAIREGSWIRLVFFAIFRAVRGFGCSAATRAALVRGPTQTFGWERRGIPLDSSEPQTQTGWRQASPEIMCCSSFLCVAL